MSRARWCVVPAALPVVAVIAMDPAGYAPFGPAKWLAITVGVLVAAAVAWGRCPPRAIERVSARLWLAFIGWATFCALIGVDRWYALLGTPERHAGVVLWMLCALAFATGQWTGIAGGTRAVSYGLVVAGLCVSAYAVVELIWRAPIQLATDTSRLGGPFGSAAFLGAACCLLGPAVVGVAVQRDLPRPIRRAAIVAAAGLVIALVGSGTRGALVAAAVVALVVAIVTRHRRHSARALLVPAACALALGIGTLAWTSHHRSSSVFDRTASVSARLDEWRIALRIIGQRPVTGTGPEGYRVRFPLAVDAAYERAHGRAVLPDRAHDTPLDVAATLGVPGLALFGALVLAVGRRIVRALRRGDALVVGLAAGVGAYGLQQLVLFPLAELEPVAWLIAGVVVATEPARRAAVTPDAERPVIGRRAVPLALGIAALAAGVLGVRDVAADRELRTSQRALVGGHPALAIDAARRAVELRPDQVRVRIGAARALAAVDPGAALRELDAAARWSPREPALVTERARLLGSPAAWRAALDRDPMNAASWLQYGIAAAKSGASAIAVDAWTTAQDLAPRDPTASLDLARLALDEHRTTDAARALADARRIRSSDPAIDQLSAELAAQTAGR